MQKENPYFTALQKNKNKIETEKYFLQNILTDDSKLLDQVV